MSGDAEHSKVRGKKSEDDLIEIYPVDRPAYVSENQSFLALLRRFSDTIHIPSITYESIHNYVCTVVQGIYEQKRSGVKDNLIEYRCLIGLVNGSLAGFALFYMLPNRMPHIQTMDCPYVYSEDMRVSYQFCLEVQKHKKLWHARRIRFVATNPVLDRVAKRLFKNARPCGTLYLVDDINASLVK